MSDFLYFITREDGGSYYEEGGVVSSTSQPTPIPEAPQSWLETGVAWERNLSDIGNVRNFTVPLKVSFAARTILLAIFLAKSIEEKIYFLIKKKTLELTLTTYWFVYRYFYKGAFDFSTLQDDGDTLTINIMEGGVSQAFKANRATTYEIDMEDFVTVNMDGIVLDFTKQYLAAEVSDYTATATRLPFNPTDTIVYAVQFTKVGEEGTPANISSADSEYGELPDDYLTSDGFFIEATGAADVTAHLRISFVITKNIHSDNGYARVKLMNSNGATIYSFADVTLGSGGYTQQFTTDANISFHLAEGEKVFLVVLLQANKGTAFPLEAAVTRVAFLETKSDFAFKARFKATDIKGVKPSVLFQKLTEKITGAKTNCDTSFLAPHDNLMLTCGDAVRGLDTVNGAPVKIKTSLDQFFQFCKTVLAMGIGVEKGKIVIAPYEHFLNADPDQEIDLGEVKDFTWSYASDLTGNVVKIGYADQQIDDVNGKYEFNNTHVYSLPQTRAVKDLTYQSPYLAQPYLIEIRRMNLDGKTTTDNSVDNDVFVLNVDLANPTPITYTATKTAPSTDGPTLNIPFDAVAGQYIIANGNKSEFTLLKNSPTIHIEAVIRITTSDNAAAVVQLQKNGVPLVNTAINTDGSAVTIETTTSGLAGDVFTLFASYTGADADIQIGACSMVFGLQTLNTYSLKRETYDVLTGVPTNTVFNVEELSPKRLLKKQMRWFNSLLWNFNGRIKFNSTEKNAELYTEKGGTYVQEKGDEIIALDRLFIPLYFEFTAISPVNLVDLLESNPNRSFRFTVEGKRLKGFLVKGAIVVATDVQQSFKLLCAPDVDVSQLK